MVKKYIFATLLSAFFVAMGATSVFAEAFLFPGATVTEGENNIYTVDVTEDTTFSAQLTLPASSTVVINGNGHKITRDTSFTGLFLSIPNSAKVTINNLVLDGNAPGWSANTDNPFTYSENNRIYGQYTTSAGANDMSATASMIVNAGQLTLNDFTLQNAMSSTHAGINSTGPLTISNSTFQHNFTVQNHAGAIRSTNELTITDSTFTRNGAGNNYNHWKDGGAIDLVSGHATIDGCTFTNNFALRSGGAIMIENANADISNSTFRGNVAGNDGPAILMWGSYNRSGVVNFKNNKFIENKGLTYGINNGNSEGIVATYGKGFGTITFDGDEFTDNQASWGSVMSIYDENSPTTLKNLSIKNVKSSGNKTTNGSGEYIQVASIENVTVDNYTSEGDQGEFFIYNGKNASITNVKTKSSLYTLRIDNVIADGIEVDGAEGTNPYFIINNSTNVTARDFTAKTLGASSSLPGIFNVSETAELENIDTEGSMRIRNINTVIADTLSASGASYDSISFSTVGNLTAKNITLKDYATENSALFLHDVAKGNLENIEISGIDGSGYSLLEFASVGEVNVKNLIVDGNTNTDVDNGIVEIYDNDDVELPENRSITFENAKITNNRSAGLGGGLMVTTRNIPITFDENSMIINNESEAGGDDVYIANTDGEPAVITLPNVIWEDKQEEEAIILGSIVISDNGAHYLKVTVLADNPATLDNIHYAFIIIGSAALATGAYLIHTRRNYRR